MGDAGTMSMLIFRALVRVVEARGGDVAAMLAGLGIDRASLADPDARVPVELAFRAFAEAPARTGDDDFGLHAAEAIPLGGFEVLDYAIRSGATIAEALERTARYYAIVDDGTSLTVDASGDVLRVVGRSRKGMRAPRPAIEFLLATVVVRGRLYTERDVPVLAVDFAHEEPASAVEHARVFGAPVRFRQPLDQLVVDKAWLATPLTTADPELYSVTERFLRAMADKLPSADPILDDVRHAVAEMLNGGEPSLETIAKKLAVSTRTLQRKLQTFGTSYQELVDSVRRELAIRYLVNERISIGEVGYLLGFSDPSTFHRAFRRWTGQTPRDYRRSTTRAES